MTVVKRSSFAPFPPDAIYDLVNDVEAYPQFLPWCVSADVLAHDEKMMRARLKVKRGRFDYAFTTANRLTPGEAIALDLVDGPFRRLRGGWSFHAVDGGCLIDFNIEFEFGSRILGAVLTAAFKPIADTMVEAFKSRAHAVYSE